MANWRKANRDVYRSYQRKWKENHPSFVNWESMMNRCYKPSHVSYLNYGNRGIRVCESWKTFPIYEKEFGHLKPGKEYTVDRISGDKHYEPGNVRWITKSENSAKKRGPNVRTTGTLRRV